MLGRLLLWTSMGLLLSGCALIHPRPRAFEGPSTWGPFPVGQVELTMPEASKAQGGPIRQALSHAGVL